ncbi:stalk domain-containing protein [Paenibacillus planticolens]|uniref:SH3 domain-containing protein n=1 Tax=Paenibacillus planticolens TaxID=2654976 RepID=A0ABX1ZLX9_9BACL|nr:NlpC/P60 family protein [Paenibacillus planticolens]NOV01051.1 SH3 domain-containing protein [Paenibacillus planticolens]
MKLKNGIQTGAACMLIILGMLPAANVHADANTSIPVFLDGHQLSFETAPIIENGYSLVPLRAIFEAEGAKVSWDDNKRTVTALKNDIAFTYRIGEMIAHTNNDMIEMPIPGKIIEGTTMIPLRLISEALGNLVKWHEYSHSITISSAKDYETTIEYGVNLREAPNTEAHVLRMIPKNENIHVIREINASWLEVQTKDGTIGFISAAAMYTNYASTVVTAKKADELLAFGAKFIGTPYEFGADSGQTNTFDCSSFVRYVFKQVLSVDLPRVSYDQALKGKEVGLDELRKGDLLFFSARGLDIGHVGIYAGDGRMLHTYSKELGVHIEEFDDKWKKRFVTARRVF